MPWCQQRWSNASSQKLRRALAAVSRCAGGVDCAGGVEVGAMRREANRAECLGNLSSLWNAVTTTEMNLVLEMMLMEVTMLLLRLPKLFPQQG